MFDDAARQRLHELRSAWAVQLQSECHRAPLAPVDVDEAALAGLVPEFVARAPEFGLVDAIWLLWLSQSGPLEASLPDLAAALECLMNAWFASTKTKSKGKYMKDAEWSKVCAAPFEQLKVALGAHQYADRILRKAGRSNSLGVNERFEQFFDEIGLPVGDVEWGAVYSRNKAAHGGSFSPQQHQALLNITHAYESLIHRVLLLLLGWKGAYIDYSTYGFPRRELLKPLGGPADDGKAAKL